MNKELHFSSESVEWFTPHDFFLEYDNKYHFALDVCATFENRKCYLFIDQKQDTLKTDWSEFTKEYTQGRPPACWMNPPYRKPEAKCSIKCKKKRCIKRGFHNQEYIPGTIDFVKKAYKESLKGCTVVCLLPARTDTEMYHEYCMKGEIEFIRGRLHFGGCKDPAPFPSMVVIFKGNKSDN